MGSEIGLRYVWSDIASDAHASCCAACKTLYIIMLTPVSVCVGDTTHPQAIQTGLVCIVILYIFECFVQRASAACGKGGGKGEGQGGLCVCVCGMRLACEGLVTGGGGRFWLVYASVERVCSVHRQVWSARPWGESNFGTVSIPLCLLPPRLDCACTHYLLTVTVQPMDL
jgi:hypothetical protein